MGFLKQRKKGLLIELRAIEVVNRETAKFHRPYRKRRNEDCCGDFGSVVSVVEMLRRKLSEVNMNKFYCCCERQVEIEEKVGHVSGQLLLHRHRESPDFKLTFSFISAINLLATIECLS